MHRVRACLSLVLAALSATWLPCQTGDRVAEDAFVALVARVTPAVVGLRSSEGPIFGSAVIVSDDGLVLTAAHCIPEVGATIELQLTDGRVVAARCLGKSDADDAGLIRITEPGPWPFAPMADEATAQEGQTCLAIGHPAGTPLTPVRRGIVLSSPTAGRPFLRTTCQVEPGDSGGALFDLEGRVVGIHSHIGALASENFHAAIDSYHRHRDAMEAEESVNGRSASGPGALPPPPRRGPRLGLKVWDRSGGPQVRAVTEGSAAFSAGFRPLDWILGINGNAIDSKLAIKRALEARRAGEDLVVRVRRGQQILELTLVLDTRKATTETPDSEVAAADASGFGPGVFVIEATQGDDTRRILATAVSAKGEFLTKASELGATSVLVRGKRRLPLRLEHRDDALDLALVRADLEGDSIPFVVFESTASFEPGRNLSVVGPGGKTLAQGVVSLAPHDLTRVERDGKHSFLGIQCIDYDELPGALISRVTEDTPAKEAGLRVDDLIVRFGGKDITSAADLKTRLEEHRPGEPVDLEWLRGHANDRMSVTLLPEGGPRRRMRGATVHDGAVSRRRDDFTWVLRHDASIAPAECGSLLVDGQGRAVGLNIARASRTSTLAIPADTLGALLKSWRQDAR